MKVLHCCLSAFYIDGYGYQENVLPIVHKALGLDVRIVASTETYIDQRKLGYVAPANYMNEDGISVTRLPYVWWMPHCIGKKLRVYEGLRAVLEDIEPNVVFLHDCQFLGVRVIRDFVRRRPEVRVFVDCHTDFINSARNWVSRIFLHSVVYRYCARMIEPWVETFWGVLPARVKFLQEMYGISASKTDLLLLGVDDSQIPWERERELRASVRQELGVGPEEVLILSGGKIDRRKKILELMRAMRGRYPSEVKLLIFGTPTGEVAPEFEILKRTEAILHVGWIDPSETGKYFFGADIAVFPGTHSVLWEQAIGMGCPCIFRRWPDMEHLDIGGNCEFLEVGDEAEIRSMICRVCGEGGSLHRMRQAARSERRKDFFYSRIAKRAIGIR